MRTPRPRPRFPRALIWTRASIPAFVVSSQRDSRVCDSRVRVLLRWQDLGPVPSFWIGAEHPFVGHNKGSTFPPLCLFPNADLNPASGQSLDALPAFLHLARRRAYSPRLLFPASVIPATRLPRLRPSRPTVKPASPCVSFSPYIYVIIFMARARVPWIPDFSAFRWFRRVFSLSPPFGFPRFVGSTCVLLHVFMYYVLGWVPVFVYGRVPMSGHVLLCDECLYYGS